MTYLTPFFLLPVDEGSKQSTTEINFSKILSSLLNINYVGDIVTNVGFQILQR